MSKSLRLLLISCGVVLLAVIGLTQLSKEYTVNRQIVVQATPEDVHRQVADLRNWQTWSPWAEDDDTLVTTLGDKIMGVGASQTWTGRDGDGALTVTKLIPNEAMAYDLSFYENTHAKANISYYEQEPGYTKITWSMSGTVEGSISGGLIALMMDKFVGPYFEVGLGKLRNILEANSN